MTGTMTTEWDPKAADVEPPADAVYPDEFAAMLDVKRSTIKHYVQQVKAGSPAAPVGFPAPDGYWLRDVPASTPHQKTRRVRSPWWHRQAAEAYKRDRLPVGFQGPRKTGE